MCCAGVALCSPGLPLKVGDKDVQKPEASVSWRAVAGDGFLEGRGWGHFLT